MNLTSRIKSVEIVLIVMCGLDTIFQKLRIDNQ